MRAKLRSGELDDVMVELEVSDVQSPLISIFGGPSGAGFGAISYHFYGQFPDIHAIARTALLLKLACAAGGILLAAGYLRRAADWQPARRGTVWNLLLVLGVTALASAAFLRWFA